MAPDRSILLLDPFSGISGDMFLGLMIDLGVDPDRLRRELGKLSLPGWSLDVRREKRRGIEGLRALVTTAEEQAHRTWPIIRELVAKSSLEAATRDLALRIFRRIAEAEPAFMESISPPFIFTKWAPSIPSSTLPAPPSL